MKANTLLIICMFFFGCNKNISVSVINIKKKPDESKRIGKKKKKKITKKKKIKLLFGNTQIEIKSLIKKKVIGFFKNTEDGSVTFLLQKMAIIYKDGKIKGKIFGKNLIIGDGIIIKKKKNCYYSYKIQNFNFKKKRIYCSKIVSKLNVKKKVIIFYEKNKVVIIRNGKKQTTKNKMIMKAEPVFSSKIATYFFYDWKMLAYFYNSPKVKVFNLGEMEYGFSTYLYKSISGLDNVLIANMKTIKITDSKNIQVIDKLEYGDYIMKYESNGIHIKNKLNTVKQNYSTCSLLKVFDNAIKIRCNNYDMILVFGTNKIFKFKIPEEYRGYHLEKISRGIAIFTFHPIEKFQLLILAKTSSSFRPALIIV
jgi:hypothetical protein